MHSVPHPAGRPTILVVEDELAVHTLVVDGLRNAGFDVIGVAAAEDALGLIAMDVKFDALLTDIELAGPLDGWELAEDVRAAWPDMPIICTSDARCDRAPLSRVPGAVFVPKPYRIDHVGALLARLLADAGSISPQAPHAEFALSA